MLLFIPLLLLGAACTPGAAPQEVTTPSPEPTAVSPVVDPMSDGGPPIHLVSIPGLAAQSLDGRDLTLGQVLADNTVYTRYSITYKSGSLTISGILNIPKGDGPFPVVFLNHGYIDPVVYTNGRGLKREQDYFARQGFAVLHSDYRCHAQSDCPGEDPLAQRLGYATDVMNAVEAVRTSGHAQLDVTRFGMLGHSMGGGVTQNVVVAKPDLIQSAVLYAPVSSEYRDSYERYTKRRPADAKRIVEIYGTAEANPEFWDNLGTRNFFERITVPLMYHHGTADADVPLAWTEKSVELLKAAHKNVTVHIYPNQPHEFTSAWTIFMQRSTDFFRATLD